MDRQSFRRIVTGIVAAAVVGLAVPVYAQNGSLRGKVVDGTGRPVDACEIILDFVGDYNRQIKTITDKNGEWIRAGVPASPGTWNVTAKKGDLSGRQTGVVVKIGEMVRLADIVVRTAAENAAGPTAAPSGMSADEIAKRNKRQAELEQLFKDSETELAAGNLDAAVAKLTTLATEVEKCAACYTKIGDIQSKKGDMAAAEAAYLKAIEIDPAQAGAYGALATIYNQQRKFDEASKMSLKANELLGTAGGGNASTVYNQGVILWNSGKAAEAKAEFEKAAKLDPTMADAHYWVGMSTYSLATQGTGALIDAKKPFEEYLKLSPTGQYAEVVKALLATIK